MSKIKSLFIKILTPIVDLDPNIFFGILKRKHPEIIVNRFEIGNLFDLLSNSNHVAQINQFEDLAFLFWSSPLNRGILRQDFDEAAALYRRIFQMKNPKGVEIGRFSGGSTILLAAAVGATGKLISIDIDPQDDKSLAAILSRYNFSERVNLIKGDANEVFFEGEELYDFVFIDGDHTYEGAKRDHNKWGAKVKPNGYIIHHDMSASRIYATQHKVLAQLKDDILAIQAKEVRVVEEVGSMCFFQKTASTWAPI